MAKELARELINAGVHFGHGASRWNPKMKPFIFEKRGKIHIINVKKTLSGLLIAKKLLAETVASGKDVVFVGTKRQARDTVKRVAEKCGMHYVAHRWLGGTLTNFRTIRSRLQRLEELEAMEADGTLDSSSKKQAARLHREMEKIRINLGGIREMNKLPGVVVVIDTNREYIALNEARKLNVPTVGIIDTNSDPDAVDVAIPANDDSIRAIELILDELGDAVAIGKTMTGMSKSEEQARKAKRSSRRALARADATEKPSEAKAEVAEGEKVEATESESPEGQSSESEAAESQPAVETGAEEGVSAEAEKGETAPSEQQPAEEQGPAEPQATEPEQKQDQ